MKKTRNSVAKPPSVKGCLVACVGPLLISLNHVKVIFRDSEYGAANVAESDPMKLTFGST